MYRIFIFCIALSIASLCTFAQVNKTVKNTNIWVGPQASIAVGELATTQSAGIGAHGRILHRIAPKMEVGGTINYTYLFPKNNGSGNYEYGGNYGEKNSGTSDLGLSGTVRYNFGGPWNGTGDIGICVGPDGVETLFSVGFDYVFSGNAFESALGLYLGICGDPKCQIGVRYLIKL